jgi:hypothetical protein
MNILLNVWSSEWPLIGKFGLEPDRSTRILVLRSLSNADIIPDVVERQISGKIITNIE